MDISVFSGHGYLLIGGLILVGIGLLLISLVVNHYVAQSVKVDQRHRERLFEYYRNTFSQLGVILIGIGISLFIFFFQQNYQDERRRENELQQTLARMSVRLGHMAPLMVSLNQYDAILDDGGPYLAPEDGGTTAAVTAQGADLARQVDDLLLVERDVDQRGFGVVTISGDLDTPFVISQLDPRLFLAIAEDESDLSYAITQLGHDYGDLHRALGEDTPQAAVADPAKSAAVKQEVLHIFYDVDLLRDRSRRLLARACWLIGMGQQFVAAKPIEPLEADYKTHREWTDGAEAFLSGFTVGQQNCFEMLRVPEGPGAP